MVDTAFLRSDELPGRRRAGYLAVDGLRTNVLHLPVRGCGDGGFYSTLPTSAPSGTRSSPDGSCRRRRWPRWCVPAATGRRSPSATASASTSHATGDAVWLEGYDAGVSFISLHQPSAGITYTVISNWSDGAWPIVRLLDERSRLLTDPAAAPSATPAVTRSARDLWPGARRARTTRPR